MERSQGANGPLHLRPLTMPREASKHPTHAKPQARPGHARPHAAHCRALPCCAFHLLQRPSLSPQARAVGQPQRNQAVPSTSTLGGPRSLLSPQPPAASAVRQVHRGRGVDGGRGLLLVQLVQQAGDVLPAVAPPLQPAHKAPPPRVRRQAQALRVLPPRLLQ